MTNHRFALLRDALPLSVTHIVANDPFVCIMGENWSLALNCPWELETPEGTIPWESENLEAEAERLIGSSLEAISAATPGASDLVFHFTGECSIHVFADTDLLPWVMRVPGLTFDGQKSLFE
ncbi:hypothetical protein StoSoilB20_14260 [Arthrobacter sp. StoSoilB20]|nr:hypothetical protein StoSoilB20_14260 [Arthrobacter sp. StoSoilB20]